MTTTYRPASEVRRIAEDLIPKHHADLLDVRIEYIFRDKASASGGKTVWGKARKISGLNAYLTTAVALEHTVGHGPSDVVDAEDYFVVEIAEDIWRLLDRKQRVALVDHELSHCGVELDKDEDLKLVIRPHSVEEFVGVIERHGLWREDVKEFAVAIQQGTLDLYGDPDVTVSVNGQEITSDAELADALTPTVVTLDQVETMTAEELQGNLAPEPEMQVSPPEACTSDDPPTVDLERVELIYNEVSFEHPELLQRSPWTGYRAGKLPNVVARIAKRKTVDELRHVIAYEQHISERRPEVFAAAFDRLAELLAAEAS